MSIISYLKVYSHDTNIDQNYLHLTALLKGRTFTIADVIACHKHELSCWTMLMILARYEVQTAKICNFWTFWPVIQLINQLQIGNLTSDNRYKHAKGALDSYGPECPEDADFLLSLLHT